MEVTPQGENRYHPVENPMPEHYHRYFKFLDLVFYLNLTVSDEGFDRVGLLPEVEEQRRRFRRIQEDPAEVAGFIAAVEEALADLSEIDAGKVQKAVIVQRTPLVRKKHGLYGDEDIRPRDIDRIRDETGMNRETIRDALESAHRVIRRRSRTKPIYGFRYYDNSSIKIAEIMAEQKEDDPDTSS